MREKRPLLFETSALTGIEEIDRQHQHLLSLFNDTGRALTENAPADRIDEIVHELLGYSIYHFNTEESLLREYVRSAEERAEAEEHIAQHRDFSQRILLLQEQVSKRQYVDLDELLSFLNSWIDDHVMVTDKALAGLVLSRREE